MAGSTGLQLRHLLEGLFVLVFVPMILKNCIDNVCQRILKQPVSIRYGPIWFVWVIGVTIYWIAFAPFKFFKDMNIPYVKPEPLFGNLRESGKLGANKFRLKYMKKLGPVFGTFLGRKPFLVIADPELLKQITVKDFKNFHDRPNLIQRKKPLDLSIINAKGETWRKIRNTASPTFSAGKIKKTVPLIQECISNLMPLLEKSAKAGESLEVFRTYGKFTMDGILSVAFGTQSDLQTKEQRDTFYRKLGEFFEIPSFVRYSVALNPPDWLKFAVQSIFDTTNPKYFADMLQPVIDERKRSGKSVRKDFVDLMLTETSDGSTKLEDDEIVATSITFLLAGYETTANTLAYTTYLLALNPEVQEKLYLEVKEKFKDDESLSVYDRIQNLEYLDQVVSESLRLYPPAYQSFREAKEDCIIGENYVKLNKTGGNKGIKLPKGTAITIPIWLIHHNPKFWNNPEEFNPERFSPENKANINPLTYLPFGYGPRNCIGMRFALLEAKLALASIIQRFKFERSPDTEVPLSVRLGVTMSPVHGIYLRVISRE